MRRLGLHGRFEAQKFLDGAIRKPGRVRGEELPLITIAEQGVDRVAEEVRRGLEPGDVEQARVGEDFLLGQRSGFHGGHRPAEQVLARAAAPLLDAVAEEAVELVHGVVRPAQHALVDQRLEGRADGGCPVDEGLDVIATRQPHEMSHDFDGELIAQFPDDVDLTALRRAVEQLIGHGRDERP